MSGYREWLKVRDKEMVIAQISYWQKEDKSDRITLYLDLPRHEANLLIARIHRNEVPLEEFEMYRMEAML